MTVRAFWGVAAILPVAACGLIPRLVPPPPGAVESARALPVPSLPAGSFDRTREQAELAQAQAARAAGDLARARALAEAATTDWPGDRAAWDGLAAIARAQGDPTAGDRAAYFRDLVDSMNTVPPRVAALGFTNLASGPYEGPDRDQRQRLAARLAAFYNAQDRSGFSRP